MDKFCELFNNFSYTCVSSIAVCQLFLNSSMFLRLFSYYPFFQRRKRGSIFTETISWDLFNKEKNEIFFVAWVFCVVLFKVFYVLSNETSFNTVTQTNILLYFVKHGIRALLTGIVYWILIQMSVKYSAEHRKMPFKIGWRRFKEIFYNLYTHVCRKIMEKAIIIIIVVHKVSSRALLLTRLYTYLHVRWRRCMMKGITSTVLWWCIAGACRISFWLIVWSRVTPTA